LNSFDNTISGIIIEEIKECHSALLLVRRTACWHVPLQISDLSLSADSALQDISRLEINGVTCHRNII
jgi:hypothetical protein